MALRNRVEVMHGVNLDQLGRRDADHYGDLTYNQLEIRVGDIGRELGLDLRFFHTNHEGEFVERLHRVDGLADGILLNPGAWTHYSWAIHDALELARIPAVEVHLSAISEREDWRRLSVITDVCVASFEGRGLDGYRDALARLREELPE